MTEAAEKIEKAADKKKATVTEERQPLTLQASRMREQQFAHSSWRVTLYPETTKKDIEDERMWVHVCGKMRVGDKIEAITEDMKSFFECIVVGVGKQHAAVQVIREVDLKTGTPKLKAKYDTEWGGPSHKWRVVRGEDVIEHGFDTQADALTHVKRLYEEDKRR